MWPPRWLTEVPAEDRAAGDGKLFVDFAEALCRITKESVAGRAGELLRMRPWQVELAGHLLARGPDGLYRHRTALIGMARKNGKSALSASLGLYGLLFGGDGAEVYSCAADRDQAKVVFGMARRMVELEPELAKVLKPYRDVIEFTGSGSVYRALSAEAYTKEGLSPTLVLFDEVHVQPDREMWDVMALALGARVEPLMVGITTAGVKGDRFGRDTLCYELYQHGRRVVTGEIDDPSLFFAWWEPADPDADHHSPDTWRESNPGFDDLVAARDFDAAVLRTPEPEFRTKRCNQWVSSRHAWLPNGAWDDRAVDDHGIADHAPVVLAFDGSRTGDSTGFTVHDVATRHILVGGLWERPPEASDWKVPRSEVKDAIRDACRRWDVLEIAWDEYLWLDAAEELADEGLPVVVFPQSLTRMGPATQRFYEDVVDGRVSHDGDPRLARHLANATLKVDSRGSRLAKESPTSPRKIDLAVCAVMGNDRAAHYSDSDYDVADSIF